MINIVNTIEFMIKDIDKYLDDITLNAITVDGDPSMATSVQYAILAGYTLFPTGCRPHKPEQNAGE